MKKPYQSSNYSRIQNLLAQMTTNTDTLQTSIMVPANKGLAQMECQTTSVDIYNSVTTIVVKLATGN